jgi:hypothetical protein
MDIDCPDCGRRVTLDANNIVPYHDNAPPLRSVCSASKGDATAIVTMLATDRAEAALAEREACVAAIEKLLAEHRANMVEACCPRHRGDAALMADACHHGADAIRARTTPATMSTDTLAAIAEARGLRVVEPERLAELEALRAAVDEETAIDRERAEHGCGDASCIVERATGMTTNGGCRCGRRAPRAALQRARKELAERGGKDGAK